jgi:thiol:disulfide interchange protein
VSTRAHAVIKPLLISSLAGLAMIAVWFTLAVRYSHALSWFALIAAVDIALLERWTRNSQRRTALWIVPLVAILCCIGSLWLITAYSISYASGFAITDSIHMMGTPLFQILMQLRFSSQDWLYLAVAPVLAFVLANFGSLNGRRQSI